MQELPLPRSRVFCVSIGIHGDSLAFGEPYVVQAVDSEREQILIKDKRGRRRWFPSHCFGAEPPARVLQIELVDPPDSPFVDVHVTLEDASRWRLTFTTPAAVQAYVRQHGFFVPRHVVIVDELTADKVKDLVRQMAAVSGLVSHLQQLED